MGIGLKELKDILRELMEREKEMYKDQERHEWFAPLHVGRYEAYKHVLELIDKMG